MAEKRDHAPSSAALTTRERVREYALALPGAEEEYPWGETVVKVNKKIFVFLGVDDGSHPLSATLKLRNAEAHGHAMTFPGAQPAGYGLGKAGWVRLPLEEKGAPDAGLLCDWVEESYRAVAPKRLIAQLDAAD